MLPCHFPPDPGPNQSPAPLSRRVDARARQAGRHPRPRGPKGGASLEAMLDASAASACPAPGAGASAGPRHGGLPRARPPSQGVGEHWGFSSSEARSPRPTGRLSRARPRPKRATIDLPLGRLDARLGWWMKVDPKGQTALTLWRVTGRGHDPAGAPIAWAGLEPKTGRTHQFRVHCHRRAGRSSATRSTARGRTCRCNCWRARSSCQFPVEAADRGRSAPAASHAGGAYGLRF